MSISLPIYMDNQSTTRTDQRVVEAMVPYYTEFYGNASSTSHPFGADARDAVNACREVIATSIRARSREIIFTSGATESNNLAIYGVASRKRRRGNHIISVSTEHKAVLDPLTRLKQRDYEVTLLSVVDNDKEDAGTITANQVANVMRDDTILVSVMLANNETGVIQPIAEIGELCRKHGVVFHCDATQAVGKIPIDADALSVDLMSFSAHKLYGPKGIGALFVRRRQPLVRIEPQIDGGGQELGLRSGTLNVPGIVGFAKAIELCQEENAIESERLRRLRDRLFQGFTDSLDGVYLIGPRLSFPDLRLGANLNVQFEAVDGESLMMSMGTVSISSGSACTSASPEPSHVLRAMGLMDDQTRSSVRFGLGRFNTVGEVEYVISAVTKTVKRLRDLR